MAEKEDDQVQTLGRLKCCGWPLRGVHEQIPEYHNELKRGCTEEWGKTLHVYS